jgi:hypothetical protein
MTAFNVTHGLLVVQRVDHQQCEQHVCSLDYARLLVRKCIRRYLDAVANCLLSKLQEASLLHGALGMASAVARMDVTLVLWLHRVKMVQLCEHDLPVLSRLRASSSCCEALLMVV